MRGRIGIMLRGGRGEGGEGTDAYAGGVVAAVANIPGTGTGIAPDA